MGAIVSNGCAHLLEVRAAGDIERHSGCVEAASNSSMDRRLISLCKSLPELQLMGARLCCPLSASCALVQLEPLFGLKL